MKTERLTSEQHFHDVQAQQRAEHFARQPESLVFTDAEYLDHESWIRPALAQLGDVAGRQILDFGCGHGMASVVLARRGAGVTAFDLSAGYLSEAQRRARANGVHADFVQADGQRLPFAAAAFDGIWGNAVLHHLDLEQTGRELRRVLKPGGVAVFCEPWGGNPLLHWARAKLSYTGKQRTPDETPLCRQDVQILKRHFPTLQIQGFQLLSMVRRVMRFSPLIRGLDCCDKILLAACPPLQMWCRYVVLTLRRV